MNKYKVTLQEQHRNLTATEVNSGANHNTVVEVTAGSFRMESFNFAASFFAGTACGGEQVAGFFGVLSVVKEQPST